VDLQAMQGNAGRKSLLFFAPFLAPIIVRLQRPQEAWPLLIDIRAADVRQRFDVTVEGRNNKEILLRALPKRSADAANYRDIWVILNAKTYLTSAVRHVQPNGRDRVVMQLEDQKINQRPSDRDQLIDPDLSGLKVTVVK
jgi:hypothetical protein